MRRTPALLAEGKPTQASGQATAAVTDAQAFVVDLAEVPAAREAYENYAWSCQDIANEFGISRQRVREIVSV